jgi:hypothetical protein
MLMNFGTDSEALSEEVVRESPHTDRPGRGPLAGPRSLTTPMRTPLPDHGLAQLRRRATGSERIERTAASDFYIWFGEAAISESRIPAGFGLKAMGAVGTNRNWNAAVRISRALDAMSV